MNSGFLFNRIAELIIQYNNKIYDPLYFREFPFASLLLISLHNITNINIFNIIYIPIFSTLPFIFFYVFSKHIFQDKILIIVLSLIYYLLIISKDSHFVEYSIGWPLLFLYIFLLYRYIVLKNRFFLILSFIILISMKFYSPYSEVYGDLYVLFFLSFLFLINIFNNKNSVATYYNILHLKKYFLISIVILIFYQPKGEIFLSKIFSNYYVLNPLSALKNFLYHIYQPHNDLILKYGSSPAAPLIPRYINIIITLLLITLFIYSILFWINHYKKNKLSSIRYPEIMIFSLLLAIIPLNLIKLSIYQYTALLPIIYLASPIFIFYTLYIKLKNSNKNFKNFYVFLLIFLIIMLSHHWTYFYYDTPRPIGDEQSNIKMGEWIIKYNYNPFLLTDFDTYNIINLFLTVKYSQNNNIKYISYSDKRYSYIIGNELLEKYDFNLYLINIITLSRSIQRGNPDWAYFKPLEEYIKDINNNTSINNIYSSNQYSLYYIC